MKDEHKIHICVIFLNITLSVIIQFQIYGTITINKEESEWKAIKLRKNRKEKKNSTTSLTQFNIFSIINTPLTHTNIIN